MDDIVEELCAAVRRHETALGALRAHGHRTNPSEVLRIEHNLKCCEQWLRLLHADDALARSRAGASQPSVRYSARRAPRAEQMAVTGANVGVLRAF